MAKNPSELDNLIAPEIKGDAFYSTIERLSRSEKIKTVLEIGSSSGGGSTQAFVNGLRENSNQPTLYCMEVSKPRFTELQKTYSQETFVKCYNTSSVSIDRFPTESELTNFYNTTKTALNNYDLERVLGWLRQDIEYVRENNSAQSGIELIKQENKISKFDMVLIDGSEFTGKAELAEVYGAKLILLDDINGFKNRQNFDLLKADSSYELLEENWNTRNGYAVFKLKETPLTINFFTLALNAMPFIQYHIDIFEKLSMPWHWHIAEGVAELKHDTAWSLPSGGKIPNELHKNGLSIDGTTQYLDQLEIKYPGKITVYRKPEGEFWDGKIEMVTAPLTQITSNDSLLWEIDCDEFWTKEGIETLHSMFTASPEKTAAYLHCFYFVGLTKFVRSMNTWATYPKDWLRVWRLNERMSWDSHEPPVLKDEFNRDVASINAFGRDETMAAGATFQHYAYTTVPQVWFKESYYGYKDAVAHWKKLQESRGPVRPSDYLPWAKADAIVDDWKESDGTLLISKLIPSAKPVTDKIATSTDSSTASAKVINFPSTQEIKKQEPKSDDAKKYSSMSVDAATQFEKEVRTLFNKIRPSKIIETGTYLGRGTSTIIWKALNDLGINADFTTIEVNPEHHRLASEWFKANSMNVNAELGLSLPRSLLPNLKQIHNEFVTGKEFEGIYYDHNESDRANFYFRETNFNVNEDLLQKTMARHDYKPDFVLLDSAGHVGYLEFQYFMKLIKGECYIMLDDVYHCKHFKTLQTIKADPRFKILVESPEKFGFCIVKFTPSGAAKRTDVNSILWVRTDSIGDGVMASSMLPEIKAHYVDAKIFVLCATHTAELYEACPFVEKTITFDRKMLLENDAYRESLVNALRSLRIDLVLNSVYSRELVNDFLAISSNGTERIALMGDLSNISAEQRDNDNKFYTKIIETTLEPLTEIKRHEEFLNKIGIKNTELSPMVWIKPQEEALMKEVCKIVDITREKTIALIASTQWNIKLYDRFAESLAQICLEKDLNIVALGANSDWEINQKVLSQLPREIRALNLCGQTNLRQTAAILKRCRLSLGVDTASAHIACAVGTPNIVVLGGGHFGRFLPYSALTSVVCKPMECFGCNWQCKHETSRCIKEVSPKLIETAIREALDSNSNQPRIYKETNLEESLPIT